ncbi:hypothetical protein [Kitasatospora sp. NBC_01266]|uniref:hypothetical protein n=1 Tax=Kitasatospora sp. NBC_01266 TaxID=2903572 RepID=UPI002E34D534|nr:hypothetical protein [Kitasatospora sp. NBC_01266]
MPARARRRSTAAAIALASAVTGTALLLTGCGPDEIAKAAPPAATAPGGATAPTAPGNPADTPGNPATPAAGAPTATAAPTKSTRPAMNGTGGSRLTISNGTQYVLLNGTSVDFGTAVRDLAWSSDGSKAVFVDGDGDLVTANPDGSGRVVVAKHLPGQSWSHPAWHYVAADQTNLTARKDIFFVSTAGGVTSLETVPADSADGTPTPLDLSSAMDGVQNMPQTANTWPNGAGTKGTVVFANTQTGDIYLRDDYLRQMVSQVAAGSEPTVTADGEEVVFVRSVGGHDHVFEQNLQTPQAPATDLTPNATTDYTEPALSPDGTTIAVRTPDGIASLPADGSAAPTLISTHPGLPAYR